MTLVNICTRMYLYRAIYSPKRKDVYYEKIIVFVIGNDYEHCIEFKLYFTEECKMDKLSTNDMIQYLKQIVSMEINLYTQKKAIQVAKRKLVKIEPKKEVIEKPELKTVSKPDPNKYHPAFNRFILFLANRFWIILAIGILIALVVFPSQPPVKIVVAIISAGIVFFMYKCSQPLKEDAEDNIYFYNRAIKDLQSYKEDVAKANDKYTREMDEYNKKQKKADEKYKHELAIVNKNYDAAKKAVLQMNEPYDNANQILQQLYDFDIIFPKYRNMVAMCTIFEYFESGRCTELGGPNGAYNLYESELRQNLIISKLDTIIDKLEEIKENQYLLYSEIRNTNNLLEGIGNDVSKILKNTNQIVKNTHITAVCSQAIAKNTEALKYISLING